jgi:hypothetical protein
MGGATTTDIATVTPLPSSSAKIKTNSLRGGTVEAQAGTLGSGPRCGDGATGKFQRKQT